MNATDNRARRSVFCAKCKVAVTWPASLSTDDKSRIAAEIRRSPSEAQKLLVAQFGFTMQEAKALVLHVTRGTGVCHRCRHPLPFLKDAMICKNCRSANLDW